MTFATPALMRDYKKCCKLPTCFCPHLNSEEISKFKDLAKLFVKEEYKDYQLDILFEKYPLYNTLSTRNLFLAEISNNFNTILCLMFKLERQGSIKISKSRLYNY